MSLAHLTFDTTDAACHSLRVIAEMVRRGEYKVTNIVNARMAGDDFISVHVKTNVSTTERVK